MCKSCEGRAYDMSPPRDQEGILRSHSADVQYIQSPQKLSQPAEGTCILLLSAMRASAGECCTYWVPKALIAWTGSHAYCLPMRMHVPALCTVGVCVLHCFCKIMHAAFTCMLPHGCMHMFAEKRLCALHPKCQRSKCVTRISTWKDL